MSAPRLGLVLSAGGLRGAAHLGVLRQIVRLGVEVDTIVGVSAGAIIGAYWAAVGLSVDEMIDETPRFRGRHIIMHGVTLRAHRVLKPCLRRFCGIIPERLRQLDESDFTVLHHGVGRIGVVCHDSVRDEPCYFATGDHHGARLADVVRASAAVPGVLPARAMTLGVRDVRLADGGISDSLPIGFARALGATHLIVSDCRLVAPPVPPSDDVVYIRPELDGIRTLRAPRAALQHAVALGEAAVTPAITERIQGWVLPAPLPVAVRR